MADAAAGAGVLDTIQREVANIRADAIANAVSNCLGGLAQALKKAQEILPAGPVTADASVLVFIRCFCCVAERAARLSAASPFLERDVHAALQTALKDRPEVAQALLSECLALVLDSLAAMHCLLAVLPVLGTELRISFCRRVVALVAEQGPGHPSVWELAPHAFAAIAAHVSHELSKLVQPAVAAQRSTAQHHGSASHSAARVQLAPYLPALVQLALIIALHPGQPAVRRAGRAARAAQAGKTGTSAEQRQQMQGQVAAILQQLRRPGGVCELLHMHPQAAAALNASRAHLTPAGKAQAQPGAAQAPLGGSAGQQGPSQPGQSPHGLGLSSVLGMLGTTAQQPSAEQQDGSLTDRVKWAMALIEVLVNHFTLHPMAAAQLVGSSAAAAKQPGGVAMPVLAELLALHAEVAALLPPKEQRSPHKIKDKGKPVGNPSSASTSGGSKGSGPGFLTLEAAVQLLQTFGKLLLGHCQPRSPSAKPALPASGVSAEGAGYLVTLTRSVLKATRNSRARPLQSKAAGGGPAAAAPPLALSQAESAADSQRAAVAGVIAKEALQLYLLSEDQAPDQALPAASVRFASVDSLRKALQPPGSEPAAAAAGGLALALTDAPLPPQPAAQEEAAPPEEALLPRKRQKLSHNATQRAMPAAQPSKPSTPSAPASVSPAKPKARRIVPQRLPEAPAPPSADLAAAAAAAGTAAASSTGAVPGTSAGAAAASSGGAVPGTAVPSIVQQAQQVTGSLAAADHSVDRAGALSSLPALPAPGASVVAGNAAADLAAKLAANFAATYSANLPAIRASADSGSWPARQAQRAQRATAATGWPSRQLFVPDPFAHVAIAHAPHLQQMPFRTDHQAMTTYQDGAQHTGHADQAALSAAAANLGLDTRVVLTLGAANAAEPGSSATSASAAAQPTGRVTMLWPALDASPAILPPSRTITIQDPHLGARFMVQRPSWTALDPRVAKATGAVSMIHAPATGSAQWPNYQPLALPPIGLDGLSSASSYEPGALVVASAYAAIAAAVNTDAQGSNGYGRVAALTGTPFSQPAVAGVHAYAAAPTPEHLMFTPYASAAGVAGTAGQPQLNPSPYSSLLQFSANPPPASTDSAQHVQQAQHSHIALQQHPPLPASQPMSEPVRDEAQYNASAPFAAFPLVPAPIPCSAAAAADVGLPYPATYAPSAPEAQHASLAQHSMGAVQSLPRPLAVYPAASQGSAQPSGSYAGVIFTGDVFAAILAAARASAPGLYIPERAPEAAAQPADGTPGPGRDQPGDQQDQAEPADQAESAAEASDDAEQKGKAAKSKRTPAQLAILEAAFPYHASGRLNETERTKLALATGLRKKQVITWFSDKKAKIAKASAPAKSSGPIFVRGGLAKLATPPRIESLTNLAQAALPPPASSAPSAQQHPPALPTGPQPAHPLAQQQLVDTYREAQALPPIDDLLPPPPNLPAHSDAHASAPNSAITLPSLLTDEPATSLPMLPAGAADAAPSRDSALVEAGALPSSSRAVLGCPLTALPSPEAATQAANAREVAHPPISKQPASHNPPANRPNPKRKRQQPATPSSPEPISLDVPMSDAVSPKWEPGVGFPEVPASDADPRNEAPLDQSPDVPTAGADAPMDGAESEEDAESGEEVGTDEEAESGEEAESDEDEESEPPTPARKAFGETDEQEWDAYIADKEDLVQNVLQDNLDMYGEDYENLDVPATPASATTVLRSSGAAHAPQDGQSAAELQWQALHFAALRLLASSLSEVVQSAQFQQARSQPEAARSHAEAAGASQGAGERYAEASGPALGSPAEALVGVLGRAVDPPACESAALQICRLVDCSCGLGTQNAAKKGAAVPTLDGMFLPFALSMWRCLTTPGRKGQAGVGAYLQLLDLLSDVATADGAWHTHITEGAQITPPTELLSDLLRVLLADGFLALRELMPDSLRHLLRIVLRPLEDADAVLLASGTLWALVQDPRQADDSEGPAWMAVLEEDWFQAWRGALKLAQRRAASLELLIQLAGRFAAALPLVHSVNPKDVVKTEDGTQSAAQWPTPPLPEGQAGQMGGQPAQQAQHEQQGEVADAVLLAAQEAGRESDLVLSLADAVGAVCAAVLRSSNLPQDRVLFSGELIARVLPIATQLQRACTAAVAGLVQLLSMDVPTQWENDVLEGCCLLCAVGMDIVAMLMRFLQWQATERPSHWGSRVKALASQVAVFQSSNRAFLKLLSGPPRSSKQEQLQVHLQDLLGQAMQHSSNALSVPPSLTRLEGDSEDEESGGLDAPKKRKAGKRRAVHNPYIKAAMAEETAQGAPGSDEDSDYSDLDDFIVCKPGRDYSTLLSERFQYSARE